MSGKIKGQQYDGEFRTLIHQYQLCRDSIPSFEGIDRFMKRYNLEHCQAAKQRCSDLKSAYKGEETQATMAVRVMDIT